MTCVTLGEVILRRVPLTAREAVTLTLSVAKEWDRHRALNGAVPLPRVGDIRLHDTGNVSFLFTPDTSGGRPATHNTETLSSLLARLLGTDEADSRERAHAATGPGVVGAAAIPAVPDESFRSVLTRFGDDDYSGIVASVFARTMKAAQEQPVGVAVVRSRTHTGPERRRQPRIVAELRLDIRELERELYALRATPIQRPPERVPHGRRVPVRVALASAAACVLALLTIVAIERNPMRAGTTASLPASSTPAAATLPTPPAPAAATVDPSATADVAKVRTSPSVRPSLARRSSAPRRHTSATGPSRTRPAATFAGGARSIDWLRH